MARSEGTAGEDFSPRSGLIRAVNGSPAENLEKVMDMMGGVGAIVGSDDVVIVKPNAQWWNQGATNLCALETFVEMVMDRRGGFQGEVVIAENCHRGKTPWRSTSSGWACLFERNSCIPGIRNLNELCQTLKRRYDQSFSVVHWVDVEAGASRVFSPEDGLGYVYCDGTGGVPMVKCDNGCEGENYRSTVMSYPIFVTGKGTVVDFKNGVWEDGSYTGQRVKFINFAALNHHSTYCGVTSVIKNYLGVTDMSGGPDPHDGGLLTGSHHNFHSFPFDKWAPGPEPGMLGKEVGTFMKTVREADLNIVTAEFVGLASRVSPPVAHTRAVLAGTDPVALDYHAAKYVLYPNSGLAIHDPDDRRGPLLYDLKMCAEVLGRNIDESSVKVSSYDFETQSFQGKAELSVTGEKSWGLNARNILKYLSLKYAAAI